MKPEQKKALGRVVRKYRERRNWTQDELATASGIDIRTVQRIEKGHACGSETLRRISEAFDVADIQLKKEAAGANPPSPDKRIPLKLVRSGRALVEVVEHCLNSGWTLELNPPDEHSYNAMVGEDILQLAEDLEKPAQSEKERLERVRHAQGIVSLSQQFGFRLFAGNFTEEFVVKKLAQRRRATLIIAAPVNDSRIISTAKGPGLDVVRDSRRLLVGAALAGHATTYNWLEDQLMSKSDGEFRVKNEFRRIMSEVMAEMNQAEEREREVKR